MTWRAGRLLSSNYLKADFKGYKRRRTLSDSDTVPPLPPFSNCQKYLIRQRRVWRTVLEYFFTRPDVSYAVNEKYRVAISGHLDDARMAPALNHIDGYIVRERLHTTRFNPGRYSTRTEYWRMAWCGDFDLRVESQSGEAYILHWHTNRSDRNTMQPPSVPYPHYRDTSARRQTGYVTAGREWSTQWVLYRSLGRLYRGIICNDLRQYVLLGDAGAMTDNIPGNKDDRWVYGR